MPKMTTGLYHEKPIEINQALELRDEAKRAKTSAPQFYCVECGEWIRAHKAGENAAAHFEYFTKTAHC